MEEILEKMKDLNMKIDSKSAEQIGKYWFWRGVISQLECVSSNVIWAIFWLVVFFKAIPFIIKIVQTSNQITSY